MSTTFSQSLNQAIRELLEQDPAVIVIGDAVSTGGKYNVTKGLAEQYGSDRIIDTPTSENGVVGFALGLAMTGAKPIVEVNGDYLLRTIDMIANHVALTDYMTDSQFATSMIIRADIGYLPNQSPQRAQSYEAMFCQIPGLTVVYPSGASDAKYLLKSAMKANRPVLFLEHRSLYEKNGDLFDTPTIIGTADVRQKGTDVTIITYGPSVAICEKAIRMAEVEEISCELIDLQTLSPLDMTTITNSVMKTGKVIIVHEAHKNCGLGSEIAAKILESEAFDYLEAPPCRIGAKDQPISYSPKEFLQTIPNASEVFDKILELTC